MPMPPRCLVAGMVLGIRQVLLVFGQVLPLLVQSVEFVHGLEALVDVQVLVAVNREGRALMQTCTEQLEVRPGGQLVGALFFLRDWALVLFSEGEGGLNGQVFNSNPVSCNHP